MQDKQSGGVFHKLTTKYFPALNIMPEKDRDELYFLAVSATATGCFAGVMAMACRIYKSFDVITAYSIHYTKLYDATCINYSIKGLPSSTAISIPTSESSVLKAIDWLCRSLNCLMIRGTYPLGILVKNRVMPR